MDHWSWAFAYNLILLICRKKETAILFLSGKIFKKGMGSELLRPLRHDAHIRPGTVLATGYMGGDDG